MCVTIFICQICTVPVVFPCCLIILFWFGVNGLFTNIFTGLICSRCSSLVFYSYACKLLWSDAHQFCLYLSQGCLTWGEQREPDPRHSRSHLFDQTNNSLTGNLLSAGGVASDDSLSDHEDSDALVEPIFDNHHFPSLEWRYM